MYMVHTRSYPCPLAEHVSIFSAVILPAHAWDRRPANIIHDGSLFRRCVKKFVLSLCVCVCMYVCVYACMHVYRLSMYLCFRVQDVIAHVQQQEQQQQQAHQVLDLLYNFSVSMCTCACLYACVCYSSNCNKHTKFCRPALQFFGQVLHRILCVYMCVFVHTPIHTHTHTHVSFSLCMSHT
jgi:hypothetical protein